MLCTRALLTPLTPLTDLDKQDLNICLPKPSPSFSQELYRIVLQKLEIDKFTYIHIYIHIYTKYIETANISKDVQRYCNILSINKSVKQALHNDRVTAFKSNKNLKELIGSKKIEHSKVKNIPA